MLIYIIYKMLYYDRLDVSEGIDVNKTSASTECIICHYQYFLNKGFRFQPAVCCNSSHDVLLMSIDIKSIANLNIHGGDYHCIIVGITKSKAIDLLKNVDLNEIIVDHQIIMKYNFLNRGKN